MSSKTWSLVSYVQFTFHSYASADSLPTKNAGQFTINGATFIPPSVPVLLQILSGTTNAQDLLPSGSVINLPLGKTVELTMAGGVLGGPHPFHLHGVRFLSKTQSWYSNSNSTSLFSTLSTSSEVLVRPPPTTSTRFFVTQSTLVLVAITSLFVSPPTTLDPGSFIVTLTSIWKQALPSYLLRVLTRPVPLTLLLVGAQFCGSFLYGLLIEDYRGLEQPLHYLQRSR